MSFAGLCSVMIIKATNRYWCMEVWNEFMLNIDDVTLYRTYDNVADNNTELVSIYPNPTANHISVESNEAVEQYKSYNMTGALVCSQKAGGNKFDIDVHELPAGAYLITLHTKGRVTTKRFMKD